MGRKTSKKKIFAIYAATLLLTMAGCGSSQNQAYTTDSVSASDMGFSRGTSAKTASYSEDAMADSAEQYNEADYEAADAGNNAESQTQKTVKDDSRKLIKTVNMSIETEEYDELINQITQKVSSLGGYIEYVSTDGNRNYRYGNIVARIPKENLESFEQLLEGSSNITYRQESVQDVTLDYVDMESHKKMLIAEQDRLLTLMEQAETIEDIIAIENRLTDVQYQIESMESQLRTYDNQIDYSTVNLDIREVVRYTPQEPEGVWERIKNGFKENLYSVGEGIQDFLIGVIISLPQIAVFAVIVLAIAIIAKMILRKIKKSHKEKKSSDKVQINAQTNVEQNASESGGKDEREL